MTNQRINLNNNQILVYYHSQEREHINCLANKANQLVGLIVNKQATKDQKQEYYALKWILKQFILAPEDLEKVHD